MTFINYTYQVFISVKEKEVQRKIKRRACNSHDTLFHSSKVRKTIFLSAIIGFLQSQHLKIMVFLFDYLVTLYVNINNSQVYRNTTF